MFQHTVYLKSSKSDWFVFINFFDRYPVNVKETKKKKDTDCFQTVFDGYCV